MWVLCSYIVKRRLNNIVAYSRDTRRLNIALQRTPQLSADEHYRLKQLTASHRTKSSYY